MTGIMNDSNMNTFDLSVQRFDEFATEYANRFMNINAYREHLDKFSDLIENKEISMLELACGPGNVTKYLKQQFSDSKIIAIDLASNMIEIARQTVDEVDFRVMDVRDVKSLNVKFDSIMCSFGLPFLSKADADTLISDCFEILNNGGIFYMSTMEGDESKAGFETTSFSGDAKVYFNYHNHQYLIDSLVQTGFSIEYNIRQDYHESDGSITIDLIIIAKKI